MTRPVKKLRVLIVTLFALIGVYICGDVADLVPGFFTLKEPQNAAQPYPDYDGNSNFPEKDISVPQMDPDAPIPDSQAISQILHDLATNEKMTGKISALVADTISGETLAEISAKRPTTPASVNKLLTAVAALSVFDPNDKFATETKYADGTLYLVAGGDVLLAAESGQKQQVIGRAGLGDLAQETVRALQAQGIKKINLALDTTIFADETYLAGAEADIKRWVMEASPIAINRNLQQSEQYLGSPKQQVLRQFTNLLRNNGIEVAASNFAPAPKTAKLLAKVESAPIREIVDLTLLNSDNTLAETLGKMIAVKTGQQGSFRNGAQAVRKELAQLGLNTDGVHLADASGLSEENRITAQLGKEILQYIAKCTDQSCAALLPALPIAKLDGTLRERFTNLPIGGKVRAKTGSLGSVTSMAGFLYTNSGRQLTFVIMIDTVPDGGAYALRPLVDHAIAQIIAL